MNVPEETIVKRRRLMFNSKPMVRVGESLRPDTTVALNMLPLPRLFFLSTFRVLPGGVLEGYLAEWLVEEGDRLDFDDKIAIFRSTGEISSGSVYDEMRETVYFRSPLGGVVEHIMPETGLVMLREEVDYGRREALVQVGQRMGVWGRKLRRLLKREAGDFVEKGQILAQKIETGDEASPGSFAFARTPIAGIVEEIDLENGLVRIRRDFREVELKAGFFGEVTALTEDAIEITAKGRRVQGVCGIGAESFGRLRVATGRPGARMEAEDVRESDAGMILIGGASVSLEALEKGREVEIAGIVTGGADHLDLCSFLGKDFAVAITGKEKTPFPVVLTTEFGDAPMDAEMFGFFKEQERKWIHVSPTTHMRAGVVRPEIVVMSGEH